MKTHILHGCELHTDCGGAIVTREDGAICSRCGIQEQRGIPSTDALRSHPAVCEVCGEVQPFGAFRKGCPNGCWTASPGMNVAFVTLLSPETGMKND